MITSFFSRVTRTACSITTHVFGPRQAFSLLATLILFGTFSAFAQQKISKVVIENIGPPAASESLVRSNIRSKEGEEYSRLTLDQDFKNLWATGLFANVRAGGQNSTNGLAVVYVLQ